MNMTTYSQNRNFLDRYMVSHSKEIAYNMTKKYNLAPVKQEQLERTFIDYYKAIDSLRNSPAGKPEKDAAYQKIVQKRDNKLNEILPDNQWKRYQADKARQASDSLGIVPKKEIPQQR
ncbi:MAG TPA: hypothetical protein DDZ96_01355 [Porphyromonadaceae bacterium]|jgi:hypothetical protein|nr:hypothetical protein [Porphyromonadaceae bacterium]